VLVPSVVIGDTTVATSAYLFHKLLVDGSSTSWP